jgi:16S rRNA (uracil1498-N3)-methyltransferase
MSAPNQRERFFVESIEAPTVELPVGEAHHALHVLRLADGAAVEVFDGRGNLAEGALRPAGRGQANVEIVRRLSVAQRPAPRVELAFAVPKGKRLDWLLEKAAELGAARLSPVIFHRSVASPELSQHARDRWRGICIAAAKQCGSLFLPDVSAPRGLEEYVAAAGGAGVRIFGHVGESAGLATATRNHKTGEPVIVVIGPEGGLTDVEVELLKAGGFAPVTMGPNVLRIETAAIALLAGVQAVSSLGPAASSSLSPPRERVGHTARMR